LSKPAALRGSLRFLTAIILIALIAVAFLRFSPTRPGNRPRGASRLTQGRIQSSDSALPLAFEANQGQTDSAVKYLARGNGYTLFLTAQDTVFSLRARSSESPSSSARRGSLSSTNNPLHHPAPADSTAVIQMHLVGASPSPLIAAGDLLPGKSNYFLGNDASKWRSNVPHYARVSYRDVYPGVTMAFHGVQRQPEFDFVLSPNASPVPIRFIFTGQRDLSTDGSGNLLASSTAGDIVLHKPVAYQEQNGQRQPVDVRFLLHASNQVTFELGNYDHNRELVIDPSISYAYSTYLGGTGDDAGYGIAFDSAGNAYVTGQTASVDFPGATNTNKLVGTADVFVTQITASGALGYSTYLGGSGSNDSGNGIAVNSAGDAFVTGGTTSSAFPTTAGAYQTTLKGPGNAFITKLSPTGAISYSTYLGGTGTDTALGIALDSSGNAYAVGKTTSANFPTHTALQLTVAGGFVTKLNSTGGALLFSTYLGGGVGDFASAVALDSSANVYVTGSTSSGSFPNAPTGIIQPQNGGGTADAFVASIKTDGSAYNYFTFLGGSDTDIGNGIAVDSLGDAYVTGQTASSTSSSTPFPLKSALQSTFGGGTYDAFVTELNPSGTALVYSTYLGGEEFDTGAGITVDGSNNAYVTGQTASSKFPTVVPTQGNLGGGNDAFVSEIGPSGSALIFSTYLGGSGDEDEGGDFGAIAVDNAGAHFYVTGNTVSTNFPTWPSPPYQAANAGGSDAFVAKYAQATGTPTFSLSATALSPSSVSPGSSATSTVTVTPPNGFGGAVSLTCTVSPVVTLGPTCGTVSATTTTPATLTVDTSAAIGSSRSPKANRFSGLLYAAFLPVGGIALAGFSLGGSRRKTLFSALLIALLLSALMLMPACGGSGSSGGGTTGGGNPGTPANTYTITVSGTATGATQAGASPTLTLTVN
jgi:hypothetical protein